MLSARPADIRPAPPPPWAGAVELVHYARRHGYRTDELIQIIQNIN